MYSWCKNRLVFCMLYRFNLCLKQLWHHAESFVLGKESRMLSNQIFCFSSFTFPSLSGIKPCQQGEKLCFSVWRVTFYAQFLHTVRSADIVSKSWLFPVRGAEFLLCKGERRYRQGALQCLVLCCAAFAVCYFLQWELFLCIWGWILKSSTLWCSHQHRLLSPPSAVVLGHLWEICQCNCVFVLAGRALIWPTASNGAPSLSQ